MISEYYVNCRHTNEMKMWSSHLWLRFKQSQSKPEKCFRGFNGIRTHGLCVSATVLHQLSYEDPYIGSRPIYWIHRTRERNERYEYYVNCEHTNEMNLQSLPPILMPRLVQLDHTLQTHPKRIKRIRSINKKKQGGFHLYDSEWQINYCFSNALKRL